jgi:signal transduction histidine kinase
VAQLGVIRRNATHLNRLISDLLDISQIESSAFSLKKINFDLGEMIFELIESLEPLVSEQKHQLTADVTEDITLNADKEKVRQVITNLIENAVKYSPVGGDINIEVSLVEGDAEIVVSDNGYGISAEDQDRIFETFFRSRTDENWEVPGTGLGLSLVKRIVSMHGGTVELESELGEGTSFVILLPILELDETGDADGQLTKKAQEDTDDATLMGGYLGTDVTDSDPDSPEAQAVAMLRQHRAEIVEHQEKSVLESGVDSDAAA